MPNSFDYLIDDRHLLITGFASLLSFTSTGFTLYLFFKYDYLRSFAFKLVSILNFAGFLHSLDYMVYVVLAFQDDYFTFPEWT